MYTRIEQWGMFEFRLISSRKYNNPFSDVAVTAIFSCAEIEKKVEGFYDGECTWVVRFMPECLGEYHFYTISDDIELDNKSGSFLCVTPAEGNHGPVYPDKQYHFSYADGTPFFVMGTTGYGWTYRPELVRQQTLESYRKYGFNKIRMLLTPKYFKGDDVQGDVLITYEPEYYPFEGQRPNFDFRRFVPQYFRDYEQRLRELLAIGAQADIILFHTYDFGFFNIDKMSDDDALFLVRYVINRFAAFPNVWWSLANEYDVCNRIDQRSGETAVFSVTDLRNWDMIGEYLMENDPYHHPRSIHNYPNGTIYPDRPWMTHVSYQHSNTYSLLMYLRQLYNKPIVNDEYQYEGNVKYEWGNSSAEEVVFRHWQSLMAGGYATHGEVYKIDGNNRDLFWTYGGTIVGQSAKRLRFLREIVESCPFQEMTPFWLCTDGRYYFSISKGYEDILIFCGADLPGKVIYPGNSVTGDYRYHVHEYDAWECRDVRGYVIEKQTPFYLHKWRIYRLKRI